MNRSPSITSLSKLSYRLGLSNAELLELARTAGSYYRKFPRKKSDGTIREIKHSIGKLKEVQALIQTRLLGSEVHFSSEVHGVAGTSALTNAKSHCRNEVVVGIDITKFYDTVTPRHIFDVWLRLGYSPKLSHLLTKLTTFERDLPMGNPPSSTLANLVLEPVDKKMRELCAKKGCTYTRYVDDVTISGKSAPQMIQPTVKAIQKIGFKVNRSKTNVMRSHSPQFVTGYVVNGKAPSKSKQYREGTARVLLAADRPDEFPFESVLGQLYHIKPTNPGAFERLVELGARIMPDRSWPRN